MTDEEIMDAVGRRIGDQAPDRATTIHCVRQPSGAFHLVHLDGKILGTIVVSKSQITVTFVNERRLIVPAIPDRPLTEADIDAAADTIVEAAGA
jgi:hypothetical protein